MTRDSMEFDVLIVGAGPAGLSTAYQLAKLTSNNTKKISICVIEKGSNVGAHILSGAIFDPKALNELIPDWKNTKAPIKTKVNNDKLYYINKQNKYISLPEFLRPASLQNKGCYIISLGEMCSWLSEQATELGVEILPGFAAQDLIIQNNKVAGVITGDMGISANNEKKAEFTYGIELRAKYTVFAEGCRGHLGKKLIKYFNLDQGKTPQHYALGIKELWQLPEEHLSEAGKVIHTFGWPLSKTNTTGGGFLYHLENKIVSLGLITDLNYTNPYLDPFCEFQQFKKSSIISRVLKGAKRLAYGARAISKGGLQSLPRMTFPGGLLVGCDAGTLNPAKIKGNHTAMKSGMIAAECIYKALNDNKESSEITEFYTQFKKSWAYQELYQSRNFAPIMHRFGSLIGGAIVWLDMKCKNKLLQITLKDKKADSDTLEPASNFKVIDYPKPDGVITFDRTSSVFFSNTSHVNDQPCHLYLQDKNIPIKKNLPIYAEPAQRYCPAGVYEITTINGEKTFIINSQNCVHCKTCDIKDPSQNINWIPPEGGGGPNYTSM